jgi:predicted nucleic acid-binding protein
LTEVLYFLGKRAGWNSQNNLWEWRRREKLLIHELSKQELDRADELMAKYADHPMDFADASLVIAAEVLEIKQIFTLDRHFHSYRLHDGRVLQVVP